MKVSKKVLFLLVIFSLSNSVISQNLNAYKYALVPARFSYWEENDKFRLNTLTKLFMQKYGFETYMEGETAPYDFLNTNCNKVYVDLVKDNGMFFSRLTVVLKDCNGKVLFTSKEGASKEKEYSVAYNEALRKAFASFEGLNHKYDEKLAVQLQPVSQPVAVTAEPKKVVQQSKETDSSTNLATTQLYAQATQNGFQVVDSEPKVVMKLYKTSVKDIYIAIKGNVPGVFVLKNGLWFFEYYQNDQLVSEKTDVKF